MAHRAICFGHPLVLGRLGWVSKWGHDTRFQDLGCNLVGVILPKTAPDAQTKITGWVLTLSQLSEATESQSTVQRSTIRAVLSGIYNKRAARKDWSRLLFLLPQTFKRRVDCLILPALT